MGTRRHYGKISPSRFLETIRDDMAEALDILLDQLDEDHSICLDLIRCGSPGYCLTVENLDGMRITITEHHYEGAPLVFRSPGRKSHLPQPTPQRIAQCAINYFKSI